MPIRTEGKSIVNQYMHLLIYTYTIQRDNLLPTIIIIGCFVDRVYGCIISILVVRVKSYTLHIGRSLCMVVIPLVIPLVVSVHVHLLLQMLL